MTKREKLESLLGRKVVLVKHTHTSIKKEDNSLVEKYDIKNTRIGVPGTICAVTGTYFEIRRLEARGDYEIGRISRCDYATKASKIEFLDDNGDIIVFEVTEKCETNLTMLKEILTYQVLNKEG